MEKHDLEYIKTTLEYLRDNTEVANHHSRTYAETFFNSITNSLQSLERALANVGTSEKDLRVCEVSKQGLFAEYLSQTMNTFGAKVEVQYVDYSKDTWTSPVRLTESRINQITNDNSVKNIRLSFPF